MMAASLQGMEFDSRLAAIAAGCRVPTQSNGYAAGVGSFAD